MHLKTILIFLIALFFFSCKNEEQAINVLNIENVQGIRNYSTLYALPKTVIRVDVEINQVISKKGPYSKYAKSLLNIEPQIKTDGIYWEINKINIATYPVPDTNHIYMIEQKGNLGNFGISLLPNGIICSVNGQKSKLQNDVFEELGNIGEKNFTEENPEKYTPELVNFNDVPLLKEITSKKNLSDQAKALAEKIYVLRDDRSAIIVGDGYTENMPDGLAMKEIIKELNKLERKYLSMFIGKQVKRTFHYSFEFTPEIRKKTTQSILFRFSHERGVVPMNDVSGNPVIIEIESMQNVDQIAQMNKRQNYLRRTGKINETNKGLFYRIPEMAIVRLISDDKTLAEKNIILSQFGDVHSLSPEYLNGKYRIEYYPELGSIKRIDIIK